jgi:hypothetical protein
MNNKNNIEITVALRGNNETLLELHKAMTDTFAEMLGRVNYLAEQSNNRAMDVFEATKLVNSIILELRDKVELQTLDG